jgi:hypothetical protein
LDAGRAKGFVRRRTGVLPPDEALAQRYRRQATEGAVLFAPEQQLWLIEELRTAFEKQQCRGHFIATEPTHVHVLVSWRDRRPWRRLRDGVKQSMTRRLNQAMRRKHWFSGGASRKRVKDKQHFNLLICEYLPSHRGWKWREGGDAFR